MILYHGSNRLFKSFDLSHASEGTGVVFDSTERLFQVLKMATPEAQTMVYEKKGNPKMTAKHIQKKQSVIQKLMDFFERYFGLL